MSMLLLASHGLTLAAPVVEPTEECAAAMREYHRFVLAQQGYVTRAVMESSSAADQLRLACDGSPQAYERSLASILAQYRPAEQADSESARQVLGEDTLGALLFLLSIGAAVSGHPLDWSGTISFH
ncbi:hypothetical protein [Chitinilyticum piscinae]|uniref:Uncharacterized protein n=1 Tax=Chitinilyticum piscinae TaxID=2866724 RepID=A0A8J7K0Q4_9NEIS|nr:hypothetical protein [Chitinilyticum piscinae]MBE9608231.1 hypothetical protein [Chitinilyticum piscinae]